MNEQWFLFKGVNTAIDELHPEKATIITFNQTDSYIYNNLIVDILPFYNYDLNNK